MVFTNKYTQDLVEKFPNFKKSYELKDAIELYGDESGVINPHTIFSALTSYVEAELINKNIAITSEEIAIYKYIEKIRVSFIEFSDTTEEKEFDSAACTCFLENLLNIASDKTIKYSRFIPYLGHKSKEYCREWDEYTGVKSEGLWG